MSDNMMMHGIIQQQEMIYTAEEQQCEEMRRTYFYEYQDTSNSHVYQIFDTKQTGINCGMFASAMAIYAISHRMHSRENSLFPLLQNDQIHTNMVLNLAHELQRQGQMNALTSLGEMFDADSLAETINLFAENEEALEACGLDNGTESIMARVIPFADIVRFENAIRFARDNHLMVLVPYYAGDKAEPYIPQNAVESKDMTNAHWVLIRGEGTGAVESVSVYEGNMLQMGQIYTLESVFNSNMSLSNRISWSHFFEGTEQDAPDLYHQASVGINSRINELLDRNGQIPFDLDNTEEIVNLRGRMVVIGHRAVHQN